MPLVLRCFAFWTTSFSLYGRRNCNSREYVAYSYLHPNDINSLSELWVYENKPIDHLLWDSGEWKWQTISAHGMLGKQIPFFQYSVEMGRELLRRDVVVTPTTCNFWRYGNVQDSWLDAYWKWLWSMQKF